MNIKTLGIFCEAGAYRGMYHCGFLQALKENQIKTHQLIGASSGFCSILSHIAGIENSNFWCENLNLNNPMFNYPKHRFHLFDEFCKYAIDKLFNESLYSEEEIIKRLNKKCGALVTRINFFTDDIISEFINKDHVMSILKATSSMPYFSSKFPQKLNGISYIDGGMSIHNSFNYLKTDIKIVLKTISNKPQKTFKINDSMYECKLVYPNSIKNSIWGKSKDYTNIWNQGYSHGYRLIEEFDFKNMFSS